MNPYEAPQSDSEVPIASPAPLQSDQPEPKKGFFEVDPKYYWVIVAIAAIYQLLKFLPSHY
jgi:hypothetical protein